MSKSFFFDNEGKKTTFEEIARNISKKLFWIYVTGHSTWKWRNWTGILHTLFLDKKNDGESGTSWKSQDWYMARMRGNRDLNLKYYGKPKQRKIHALGVLW